MTTDTQRWTVGDALITSVVEDEIAHIPPEFFFPAATASAVRAHPWVLADYADPDGNITLRVQALIVEHAGRTVLVDPCVGNFKTSELPFWNQQEWPFMDRFIAAGFSPDARHLYTAAEMDLVQSASDHPSYRESILPILDAGLADIVSCDADLGAGCTGGGCCLARPRVACCSSPPTSRIDPRAGSKSTATSGVSFPNPGPDRKTNTRSLCCDRDSRRRDASTHAARRHRTGNRT